MYVCILLILLRGRLFESCTTIHRANINIDKLPTVLWHQDDWVALSCVVTSGWLSYPLLFGDIRMIELPSLGVFSCVVWMYRSVWRFSCILYTDKVSHRCEFSCVYEVYIYPWSIAHTARRYVNLSGHVSVKGQNSYHYHKYIKTQARFHWHKTTWICVLFYRSRMSLIFQKTLQNVGPNLTICHNDQFILGEIQERAILVLNSVKYIVQYEIFGTTNGCNSTYLFIYF